jgi:hypothetical protein
MRAIGPIRFISRHSNIINRLCLKKNMCAKEDYERGSMKPTRLRCIYVPFIVVVLLFVNLGSMLPTANAASSESNGKPYWGMYQADAGATGLGMSRAGASTGSVLWVDYLNRTYFPNEQRSNYVSPVLVGPDGSIYLFYSDNSYYPENPSSNGLVKFDENGRVVWNKSGFLLDNSIVGLFSGAITSKGDILFTGFDRSGRCTLFSMGPDGVLEWSQLIASGIHGRFVIGPSDISYLLTINFTQGTILEMIGSDGSYFRNVSISNSTYVDPGYYNLIVAPNGTAYVTIEGNITAVKEDGTMVKILHTSGYSIYGQSYLDEALTIMLRPDGTLIVKNLTFLTAIRSDGGMIWSVNIKPYYSASPVSLASDGTLLLLVSTNRTGQDEGGLNPSSLMAVSSEGVTKWVTNFSIPAVNSLWGLPPLVSSEGIAFLGIQSTIVAVNPDGSFRWQRDVGWWIEYGDLAIGKNGVVLCVTSNGVTSSLIAIGPATINEGQIGPLTLILPPLVILSVAVVGLYALRARKK